MTAIPQGSEFQVVFQGQTTLTKSPDQILAEMTPYLMSNGLTINSTAIASSGVLSLISLGAFGVYVATLDLNTTLDTDDGSVTAEISQAYQLVTKQAPISISIPNIGGTSTGVPAPSGISPSSVGNSVEDAINAFFAKIQSLGTSLLIGLAAVVIVVLLIIGFSPNVKHVAAAL